MFSITPSLHNHQDQKKSRTYHCGESLILCLVLLGGYTYVQVPPQCCKMRLTFSLTSKIPYIFIYHSYLPPPQKNSNKKLGCISQIRKMILNSLVKKKNPSPPFVLLSQKRCMLYVNIYSIYCQKSCSPCSPVIQCL